MTFEHGKHVHDHLAEYVHGGLSAELRREIGRHLEACRECSQDRDAWSMVLEPLADALPPVAPSDGVWGRIRGAVRSQGAEAPVQAWKDWSSTEEGAGFVLAQDAAWEPTGREGIEARKLSVDRESDRVTMLVRMAAGTSYPAHRHTGPEECYVLDGDLRVGDVWMRRGDYQRAPAGSLHPEQSTEGGCVLLLVSSLSDELLEND